tara:strand:+ start:37495 stop:37626 length:132 start_codon:yes stop_codon:yes gene_type:complete
VNKDIKLVLKGAACAVLLNAIGLTVFSTEWFVAFLALCVIVGL